MKLADWLKKERLPRFRFAERICVQPSVITDYCRGRYAPRPKTVAKIIRETGGEVTANDFLTDEARSALEAAK
ncbi:MAG: helix-turn-helix transcriptional regulator [Gammaproteobacteria bacterium]